VKTASHASKNGRRSLKILDFINKWRVITSFRLRLIYARRSVPVPIGQKAKPGCIVILHEIRNKKLIPAQDAESRPSRPHLATLVTDWLISIHNSVPPLIVKTVRELNNLKQRRIWGSHGGEYEDGCLLGWRQPRRQPSSTQNNYKILEETRILLEIWVSYGGEDVMFVFCELVHVHTCVRASASCLIPLSQ
jgi:hypothetical protein